MFINQADNPSLEIELKTLTDVRDFVKVTRLQEKIFGFDQTEVVPRLMRAVEKSGGQVLGAFVDEEKLVGFVFALAAFDKKRQERFLLSHIVGVDPEYQRHSIGYRLKQFQRKLALESGVTVIRWTFDPLLATNAYFNLEKLKARIFKFCPEEYGQMKSEFYHNMPSDRFEVTWDLVGANMNKEFPADAPEVIEINKNIPVVKVDLLRSKSAHFLCPIPLSHLEMRKTDPTLALTWYEVMRKVSSELLDGNYAITGFRYRESEGVGEYLFTKQM